MLRQLILVQVVVPGLLSELSRVPLLVESVLAGLGIQLDVDGVLRVEDLFQVLDLHGLVIFISKKLLCSTIR